MSEKEDEVYHERLIDHYEDPFNRGDLEGATHEAEAENQLCGDTVRIQLRCNSAGDEVHVSEAGFDGEGCVVSQAAASILIEHVQGMQKQELEDFSAAHMLRLLDVNLKTNRQKCALLPWRALQDAIRSPIDFDEDGPTFGGPHLGEEN